MKNARISFAAHGINRIKLVITEKGPVIGLQISPLHCEKRGTTALRPAAVEHRPAAIG